MKVIGTTIAGLVLLHIGLVLLIFFYFNSHESTNVNDLAHQIGYIQVTGAFIFLGGICLWVITLAHALRNPSLTRTDRLLWVGLIVFLNLLGAILYCFISPKRNTPRYAEQGAAANP